MVRRTAALVVRQYDVCRNPSRSTRSAVPYFIVLQADLLSHLQTVVVAPIMREDPREIVARLNPSIVVDGKQHRIIVQELAALPHNQLGPRTTNLSDRHYEFVSAIDLLFTGV